MLLPLRARIVASSCAATTLVLGGTWLVAEVAVDDETTRAALRRVLALAAALALAVAIGLAEWIVRRFAQPLDAMRRSADALARGDFEVRVRSRRKDELGALGRAIDRMADQLADRLGAVRAQEARLGVMLDAMQEAVLVTDADGSIVLSNAAFVRLTGSAGLGKSAVEAIRSAELHDAVTQATRGGKPVAVSFAIEKGRTVRSLSGSVAPLPNGAGTVVVLHDVTELRRLDAVRRDFVANASHELRTPLTAIRGFAETLRDGALKDPTIARRFLDNIVDNAVRLQRLVDDLLELSRAESPEAAVALEPLDPVPVAERVLAALEPRARARNLALDLERPDADVTVRGDERALDQVLLNLVDNAVKYTPAGGRVVLRFRPESAHVTIEVEDTGPGIAPSHLPRIFERFYRVDAGRSREHGGTGLGLAIVKHLTQRMRGDVSVQSEIGRGSTFRVRLERAVPTPELVSSAR